MKRFSGLDQAEFQKADIHEALDTTLMLLDHKLRDRVTVLKQYGELPEIYCYPNRLNQVFMNLLLNAAQAIEGEGTIWVKTESTDELLRVTIADNGRGIPSEYLGRVFDPGFTTKGVGVGTGLGLSICYSIIQDHGGRIGVTSQSGIRLIVPGHASPRLGQEAESERNEALSPEQLVRNHECAMKIWSLPLHNHGLELPARVVIEGMVALGRLVDISKQRRNDLCIALRSDSQESSASC